MLIEQIIIGIVIAIFSALLGGMIQWGRSGTAQALQSRDINDINKDLGALKQTLTLHIDNFEKFAKSFRPRVQHIEEHLKLKDQVDQTGKFPAFTGVRPSGEQETVK